MSKHSNFTPERYTAEEQCRYCDRNNHKSEACWAKDVKERCMRCGRGNHTSENYWEKHGYPKGFQKSGTKPVFNKGATHKGNFKNKNVGFKGQKKHAGNVKQDGDLASYYYNNKTIGISAQTGTRKQQYGNWD